MRNNKTAQINLLNQFKIDINSIKNQVQIKSGAFGLVYLVQDKKTEEYYEAKVLNYHKNDSKYKQGILREIAIIICVQYPTIIKFHGFSEQDFEGNDNVTVIMDYPANGSLEDAIKNPQNLVSNNQYDNTARQIILAGVAYGMMHLHKYHIVNPSLNPKNILLDRDLRPYITNFGLSKFFERKHSKNQSNEIESLIYTAPEVISENHYNSRSDVYSFGILMYEIITESTPYPLLQETKQMTINQFKEKVVQQDYRPGFKVPIKKSLRHLIERCWSKNLKKRPNFEELYNKLAFNIEDTINDLLESNGEEEEPDKYYLDDVDTDMLQSYIDDISRYSIEKRIKKSQLFEKENKPLKNSEQQPNQTKENSNKSIYNIPRNFNQLPLNSQQNAIKKLVSKSPNDSNLNNLNKLIEYLNQVIQSGDQTNLFQIVESSPQQLKKVFILFPATEQLFATSSLDTIEARDILNSFEEVFIEVRHPSETFKDVYEVVSNLRSLTRARIRITLYLDSLSESDEFFKTKTSFSRVRMNDAIDALPRNAFEGYSSLGEIKLPEAVISIGDNGFKGCKQLVRIVLPNRVKSIGSRCFNKCVSLEEVALPDSIASVGSNAFRDCQSLLSVELPSRLQRIEDSLFSRCASLKRIVIPSSVSSIGSSAFSECLALEDVTFPDSLVSIGKNAFEGCVSLVRAVIPPSVTTIGWSAFSGCTSLVEAVIPSSVKDVKYNVFSGCTRLEHVVIDPYSTQVSPHAFEGLNFLNHMTIGNSVKVVEFQYFLFKKFKRITLPESVRIIDKNGFAGCSELRIVDLPSSLTSIGDSAFFGCAELSEIDVPSGLKSIGASAFSGCESLVQVTIPASVSLIGTNAFYGCTKLERIQILSCVTSIGESAFQGCASLKEVTICSPVNSIGSGAFSGCASLMQIQIPYAVSALAKSQKYQLLGIGRNVKIVTI